MSYSVPLPKYKEGDKVRVTRPHLLGLSGNIVIVERAHMTIRDNGKHDDWCYGIHLPGWYCSFVMHECNLEPVEQTIGGEKISE